MNIVKMIAPALLSVMLAGYEANALATQAPHSSSTNVAVVNNTGVIYLPNGYSHGSGNYSNTQFNYIPANKTVAAFSIQRRTYDISGEAPEGHFSYQTVDGKTTCTYNFDHHGVSAAAGNGPNCGSQIKNSTKSSAGVTREWDAIIYLP